jgi:hypothetical protein
MNPHELAAFRAGILHASHMAIITATEIELRDDAGKLRQRAAIEALRGLAEGLKVTVRTPPTDTETAE